MLTLSTPVQYVKGVGEERARILENKGILTVEDLLFHVPFRYEDRTRLRGPEEVRPGEMATVIALVRSAGILPVRRRRMSIFCADVGERGAYLRCKWFNAPYLQRIIKPGQYLALHGKVEVDFYEGGLHMVQPQYEILPDLPAGISSAGNSLEVGRIVPIYEAAGAGRLTSRFFRRVVHFVLETLAGVEDPLPPSVAEQYRLIPRWEAIRNIHFPPAGARLSELAEFRSAAHLRLIFEEFFFLETGLALKRKQAREVPGIAFRTDARIRECLKRVLPFHPTEAQKKALGGIVEDMRAPRPMRRLLQGDVGSGKTIVALQAAAIAIENGYQVVMMAPTEILAMQHYFYFRRLLQGSGYRIVLLTGSATSREKKAMKRLLREGLAQVAIGTHALVEQDVEFKALGLVVIDEQHRFGVMQRLRLMKKASAPDTLVMTATPIPRTLALTLYGDLDVSVIDELPAGRLPVLTRQIPEEASQEA
ncbi:MAG TPA: DEAD/DEAH box helicase, partial [Roseiflexaceae bacterium]